MERESLTRVHRFAKCFIIASINESSTSTNTTYHHFNSPNSIFAALRKPENMKKREGDRKKKTISHRNGPENQLKTKKIHSMDSQKKRKKI